MPPATTLVSTTPVSALRDALDALAGLDVDGLDGAGQAELLSALTQAESRISSVRLRVLAAADRSRTALTSGAADTSQWAARVANADQAQMHRQVRLAHGLNARAETREALADGAISSEHAAVIVQADHDLPDEVTVEQRRVVAAELVAKAQQVSPPALRRAARRALAAVEADTALVDAHENQQVADREEAARAKTRLTLHDNGDGTVTGHFTIPVAQGHLLRKVIETITAPRRGRLGSTQAQTGRAGLATDWDHARGEAFCELVEHLPTDHLHPRTAATLVVTISEETLRQALRVAHLDTGETLSAGEARRLACGARILPAVLGGASLPLDLGRSSRLFSDPQRTALGLRHQTCAAEGCERPFAWCELHHRQPWSQGGSTDLSDAIPLCHFHHRRIHDGGYVHRIASDGSVTFHRRT